MVAACLAEDGWGIFAGYELHATAQMWFEAGSVLHELGRRVQQGRGPIGLTASDVAAGRRELEARMAHQPPMIHTHVFAELLSEAWRIADNCGMHKLYDPYHVALASRLRANLVTTDGPLMRGPAAAEVTMIAPADIKPLD